MTSIFGAKSHDQFELLVRRKKGRRRGRRGDTGLSNCSSIGPDMCTFLPAGTRTAAMCIQTVLSSDRVSYIGGQVCLHI